MNEGVKNFFLDKEENEDQCYLIKRCNNIIYKKLKLKIIDYIIILLTLI